MYLNPIINEEVIHDAYGNLAQAKVSYADALERSLAMDASLEKSKAIALNDGTVIGKNETERKAALSTLFAARIAELEAAERETRSARVEVELAEIEVKRVETLVRWLK